MQAARRGRLSLPTLATVGAALLVVGVTVLQGLWTDRWTGRSVGEALAKAARLLEERFPDRCGDWELEQEITSDPKELERAGAVGHVARVYRNTRTKSQISVFVVCATYYDASGHTPDRCYPGAGFEIAEAEHRQTVTLHNGGTAETYTGTFRKQGQTLRVFWTYRVGAGWVAPQIARFELAGEQAVYKLYAIIDETRIRGAQATSECLDFLASLLPALDASLAVGPESSEDRESSAAPESSAGPSTATPAPEPNGPAR